MHEAVAGSTAGRGGATVGVPRTDGAITVPGGAPGRLTRTPPLHVGHQQRKVGLRPLRSVVPPAEAVPPALKAAPATAPLSL